MTAKNNDYYHLGLTDSEVLESREKNGVNLLTPPKRPSLWKLYLEKFRDPVIRILLVAAFFSLVIAIIENEYAETIGIFFAIFPTTYLPFSNLPPFLFKERINIICNTVYLNIID